MNVIELRNVSKKFDSFVAVNNLSFEVKRGTTFGLLGPNGAGKTTSIRMILDIFAPDSGEIAVLGEHVSSPIQQRVGYLPEERGLYKKMKVGEQLIFFANLKGVSSRDAQLRAYDWLEKLQLKEWKDKKAIDLSKGMQQKVQFIACILHDPELLILDEPFSGLDPVSVELLKNVILDLKKQGKTVIFSTHQMEQVEQMCDEMCLINHGTKVLSGSVRDVKRSFGRNTVIIDYEGSDSFASEDLVKRHKRFANHSEMILQEGVDAQEVLKRAIESGARVNRFELVEPSLNEIFIECITGKKPEQSLAAKGEK